MTSALVSYLFVPASRPDRFEKALATEADAVIVDLEDAVARADKDAALAYLLAALAGLSRPVHVRINAADSEWFARDLEALAGLAPEQRHALAGVVVPKVQHRDEIARVSSAVGEPGVELIALIESAAGVAGVREIAATPGLTRLALGAADLSFDLDADIRSATIDWTYAQLVVASRIASLVAPIASPPFEIDDQEGIARDAARLRGLGVTAQLCIHPGQLAAVHAGFRPDEASIAWARRVIAAESDGATQVDGQLVDKPIRERAERILRQALINLSTRQR